jgi:hypothetical protein
VSAFRFSKIESGSWRWGKLHRNDATIAHAVAASAAYPLFLPAFDETLTFEKDGALKNSASTTTSGSGAYGPTGRRKSASMSFPSTPSSAVRLAMACDKTRQASTHAQRFQHHL